MNSTSHNLARFVMEVKSLLGWLGERETQRLVMRHIYVVGCQAASSFCEKRRRNPPDSRSPQRLTLTQQSQALARYAPSLPLEQQRSGAGRFEQNYAYSREVGIGPNSMAELHRLQNR